MVEVRFTENYDYCLDKVNITKFKKDSIVGLPEGVASRLVHRGVCIQILNEDKKANNFTPVEETAVIEPVQEVKDKPKRKRRKKKAE